MQEGADPCVYRRGLAPHGIRCGMPGYPALQCNSEETSDLFHGSLHESKAESGHIRTPVRCNGLKLLSVLGIPNRTAGLATWFAARWLLLPRLILRGLCFLPFCLNRGRVLLFFQIILSSRMTSQGREFFLSETSISYAVEDLRTP